MYLELLGWKYLTDRDIKYIISMNKSIVLFPHTSSWDNFSVLMYVLDYIQLQGKIHIFVDKNIPNVFPTNHIFPNYFKPILVDRNKKSKLIENVVEKYKDLNDYHIFMSPEGSREKSAWKSGYLALSTQLNIPISIIGFDYNEHKIKIIGNIIIKKTSDCNYTLFIYDYETNNTIVKDIVANSFDELKNIVEPILQEMMSRINVLYSELSYVSIKNSKYCNVFSEDIKFIYILLLIIVLVIFILLLLYLLNRKKYI